MSFSPDEYQIKIVWYYSVNQCQKIIHNKTKEYTCYEDQEGNMILCCQKHVKDLEFDKCYQLSNHTTLKIECIQEGFDKKDLLKIILILAMFILLFSIIYCSVKNNKQRLAKEKEADKARNIKLLDINSKYKYNSMYQTF